MSEGTGKPLAAPPATPDVAAAVFGDRLRLAELFTALLADTGMSHGLIGPREVPRLWERHVLNCAVMHAAIQPSVEVIDVGSGAGLPGLALAIARPDLHLHLVEPMLRRTTWLTAAVDELELTNVTVHRGRAEQYWGTLESPVVTARAVCRLSELARWCLPLLQPGGVLLALKGASVAEELRRDEAVITALGAVEASVELYGSGVVEPQTTVLRLTLGDRPARRMTASSASGPHRSKRRRRHG